MSASLSLGTQGVFDEAVYQRLCNVVARLAACPAVRCKDTTAELNLAAYHNSCDTLMVGALVAVVDIVRYT